jgi:hypothetical protein
MLQVVLSCGDRLSLLGSASRHVAPRREAYGERGAVVTARKAMSPRTEVRSAEAESFQKVLGLRW